MEALRPVERESRKAEVILADIEMAHEAAEALRSLEGGTYRSKDDVAEMIAAYQESIEGIDPQTLLAEKLLVFPGSSRLH